MLKACQGSIQKALLIHEKKDIYTQVEKIFNNVQEYKLIDVLNKLDILYKNKDDIQDILDYINILFFEKINENQKYIEYIKAVEAAKNSIKSSNNYDMTIDKLLLNIWEER